MTHVFFHATFQKRFAYQHEIIDLAFAQRSHKSKDGQSTGDRKDNRE